MVASCQSILVVLSNWTYPGQEGLHLQNAAVFQGLCQSGMRVHVLALARDPCAVDVARVQADWGPQATVTVLPNRLNYPLLLLQSLCLPLALNPQWRAFDRLCRALQPDLVHLEGIGLTPWLRGIRRPVLMSAVDAWSLRQQRLAARASGAKRLFLRAYAAASRFAERRHYASASAVHVVSEDDAAYLRSVCPAANVQVVPVGLMTLPDAPPETPDTSAPAQRHLVFWGDLGVGYLRDGLRWLLRDVLPGRPGALRAHVRLTVLGRRAPDEDIRAAAGDNVTFLEWVEDVDAVLHSADAVVLPDASGSGMKNRTLHAMACCVPVLGTSFAFEGVMAKHGSECMVQDRAEGFASALQALLEDRALARNMGHAGRAFVLRHYSMPAVVQAWHRLYQSCMQPRNGAAR